MFRCSKAEHTNWMLWKESPVVGDHAISLFTTLSVMDKAAVAVAVVMMAAVEDAVVVAVGVEMTRRKSCLSFLKRSISSFQPRSRKRSTKRRMLQRKAARRNLLLKTLQPTKLRWWSLALSLLRCKQPGLWAQ